MSKKLDPDIKALKILVRGCKASTPRMIRANLEYVWDRFVGRSGHTVYEKAR